MNARRVAVAALCCLAVTSAVGAKRRAVRAPSPGTAGDLVFVADAGIRVDNATNPGVATDSSGKTYLFYNETTTNRRTVVSATDALTFSSPTTDLRGLPEPHALLMPDEKTWRVYEWDLATRTLKSKSSSNGIMYEADAGIRYRLQTADNGTVGIYELFSDLRGGVVLLYIGDLMGLNNVRRAYSTDNGLTFTFDHGNVLGDDNGGGGANSYVDQKVMRLPDGRLRLFAMRQFVIHSFLSIDDGITFVKEDGARLERIAFRDIALLTLNDPVVLRLADGRYRMYVAAAVAKGNDPPNPGPDTHWVIVSATTP